MKTVYCTIDPRYKKTGKAANGTFNIKLYVYITEKDRRYFKTKFNVTLDEWERMTAKNAKDQRLLEIRSDLREIEANAAKVLNKLDEDATIAEFYEAYFEHTQKRDENMLLSYWFEKYMKHLQDTNHPHSYVVTMRTSRNSYKEFNSKQRINQVTNNFLNQYCSWIDGKNVSLSTKQHYLRNLRTVINYAIEKKAISPTKYPFGNRGFTIGTTSGRKLSLTKEKVIELINLDLSTQPDLDFCRDIFLFQYLCNGLNVVDMCKLQLKNIDSTGEFLSFIRTKTIRTNTKTVEIRVYINPLVKNIIEKWGTKKNDPEEYIFPFFETSNGLPRDQTSVRNRTLFMTKKLNKKLRKISAMLGLPYNITTGLARHTYATILARSGTPIKDISCGMGHTSARTTEIYIANTDDQRIKDISSHLT